MAAPFTKKQVIEQLQSYVAEELSGLLEQSEASGKELPQRAEDLRQQLVMYRFLPVRDYGADDVICPGGLVELEHNRTRAFYFIVPSGGGLVTRVEGYPVQVITPHSPLGEALLGRKAGDSVKVFAGGKDRHYKVVGYF
ncbi:MAG: GreA/GreB family elongation factor [Oligoflexia bacterium]|nr:GreA/GreB family elongation factor [Oligoflexia bacterium]